MAISEEAFEAAAVRCAEARGGGYAVAAEYDARQGRVCVGLSNDVMIMVPVRLLEDLAGAGDADLREIEITPSGLGLHWPRLDADVYVPALMRGVLGSKRWTAARLGAAGGRSSTAAKATAARENGRKGGRPRKQA